MNVAQAIAGTFKFHNAIYISLTESCPLRCRHCFVESAPERNERADLDSFKLWVDSIAASGSVTLAFLSGGEPFNHPNALRYAVSKFAASGIYNVACTSAFFARTPQATLGFLERWPGLSCLGISTDIYHEEFVPLQYLRNAYDSASELGLDVHFQICEDAPESSPFVERFRQTLGDEVFEKNIVYFVPLKAEGRAAKELGPIQEQPSTPDDNPCIWSATPWLREDGVLAACPNLQVFKSREHPLHLGNLKNESFAEISQRANHDAFLQLIRTEGPAAILARLPLERFGYDEDDFNRGTLCGLCHSLCEKPELIEFIRASVSQEERTRNDLLRFLMYYETHHLITAS